MKNPDGSHNTPIADGQGSSDRGLSGALGQMAMNQILGGGKKQNKTSSGGGGLGSLAGQLLGGSSHGGASHSKPSATSAITGTLVNSLLGGKQQGKTGHSQSGPGGLMSAVGGLFGKNDKNNSHQAGYSNPPPPNSYQQVHQAASYEKPQYQAPNSHGNFYPHSQQQPHQNYGPPPNAGHPPPPGQPPYNTSMNPNGYPNQGNQYHTYGYQPNSYGNGHPPPPYQQPNGPNSWPGQNANPPYSGSSGPPGGYNG